jgi:hypothetical protein
MAWRLPNPGQLRLAPLDPARTGQEHSEREQIGQVAGPYVPDEYGPMATVVGQYDQLAPGAESAVGQPPGLGLGLRDSESRHSP